MLTKPLEAFATDDEMCRVVGNDPLGALQLNTTTGAHALR